MFNSLTVNSYNIEFTAYIQTTFKSALAAACLSYYTPLGGA